MKPKVELHLHLEGAAPPAFIRGLARKRHMDLSGLFTESGGYRFKDFWEFLKVYEAAVTTLQTPQDFHDLTLAVLDGMVRDGTLPRRCGRPSLDRWADSDTR